MTVAALVLREATAGDARALSALGRKLYRIYFEHLWTKAGFDRFLDDEMDADLIGRDIVEGLACHYWIDLDGEAVGFAKTKPDHEMPDSNERGTLLEKLYILPQHTSRGLGQQVLSALMARARADGASLIWLDVLKINDRARRAYEKAGFTISGEAPFSTDLHDIGFFVMCRRLS